MASPGLAILAIAFVGVALSPSESPAPGSRVESRSFTEPTRLARCIAYNINRKMPNLTVRSRPGDTADDSIFLVLSTLEPAPATFGVIRLDQTESGSQLTTWLPAKSLTASADQIAGRLVAGC